MSDPPIVVRLALGLSPRWPTPRGSVTSIRTGHSGDPIGPNWWRRQSSSRFDELHPQQRADILASYRADSTQLRSGNAIPGKTRPQPLRRA